MTWWRSEVVVQSSVGQSRCGRGLRSTRQPRTTPHGRAVENGNSHPRDQSDEKIGVVLAVMEWSVSEGNSIEWSSEFWMKVPESCSAEVDVMREMANTIKTETLAELNVTRKRLHQMASDFVGCNTLTIQVSTCRSTFRAEVKSHMSCARSFERDESQLNSSVREGKSDCRRRRYRANVHAFCQGNIGHVFGRHGRNLQQVTQCG